jgi:hypothetical protein
MLRLESPRKKVVPHRITQLAPQLDSSSHPYNPIEHDELALSVAAKQAL